ncbi:MAG TPA: tRNA adenosine(34) deaminase TadA [Acidobacteriota bacterium]|nr:tRNA adenosine(34) deaminase TadA [Acidobacteriota bacterium]
MSGPRDDSARADDSSSHRSWMALALEEARRAAQEGEVPIGAVAVLGGQLVARQHNRTIQLVDPTAHAEVLVLREAARKLGNYRLNGLEVFVTVEPCSMCAGAAIWARIARCVFAARDEKAGAVVSKARLFAPGLFNHQVQWQEGPLAEESRALLQAFFAARR